MAGEEVTINISQVCISDAPPESDLNETANSSGRRLCPLCQSPIRLFYINFNDKFLMCENTQCEFPFGHEELKIVKAGEEMSDDGSFTFTTKSRCLSEVSGSTVSGTDRVYKLLEPEESPADNYSSSQPSKLKTNREQNEQIMKNIEDIRELNEELMSLNEELLEDRQEEDEGKIKNEKWIKNLKNLQEMSGMVLLKPEEMGFLKKQEPAIGLGELKFDIIEEGNSSSVSGIRIEFHNSPDTAVTPDKPKGKDPFPV